MICSLTIYKICSLRKFAAYNYKKENFLQLEGEYIIKILQLEILNNNYEIIFYYRIRKENSIKKIQRTNIRVKKFGWEMREKNLKREFWNEI